MMNTGSAFTTAMLRGLYVAVGSGLTAGLMSAQQGLDDRGSVIVGMLAGLFALGFRGGVEGGFDQHRDSTGDVKQSDVSA